MHQTGVQTVYVTRLCGTTGLTTCVRDLDVQSFLDEERVQVFVVLMVFHKLTLFLTQRVFIFYFSTLYLFNGFF